MGMGLEKSAWMGMVALQMSNGVGNVVQHGLANAVP